MGKCGIEYCKIHYWRFYEGKERGKESAFPGAGASGVSASRDVVMGLPVLYVLGQSELHLENYRGILEYTEEMVRILIKGGQIKVTGQRLQVVYYTNDEMKISGQIRAIEYHR